MKLLRNHLTMSIGIPPDLDLKKVVMSRVRLRNSAPYVDRRSMNEKPMDLVVRWFRIINQPVIKLSSKSPLFCVSSDDKSEMPHKAHNG